MVADQRTTRRLSALGDAGESRRTAWGLTGVLVLMYMVNFADKAVLGIIAQPLAHELGLSSSEIGLAGSVFFLMLSLGGLLSGVLDRWLGLRWALAILAILWSVAMLPLIVAAGFATLLASRMLLGLAEGPNSALLYTATYSWHPPARRGLPGALLACAASIAKIAIAPMLAYVAVAWGWRSALVALSIIGLGWCVLWLLVWSEGPYRRRDTSPADGGGDSAAPHGEAEPAVPWTRIFRSPTFVGGALIVISVYALVSVVLTWLPSYFETGLGYSRLQAGSMFSIPSLFGLVIMLSSTWFSDRLVVRGVSMRTARVIMPVVGLVIGGCILATLPYITTPVFAVLVVSIGYAVGSPVFPLLNAAVAELCPPRQVAGTLGVFLSLMAIGGFIAPYLMGRIVDAAATSAGGYATAFQILGVVAVAAGLLGALIIDPERDKRRLRGLAAGDVPQQGI
ncbi:MFS transporter [Rhodococcus sp. ACPA1]|uniref:MFS transporter n=1 Tax=Rhodococcus sp. ACPA1 TaxID=2028572 RepID=UPI000BB12E9D|nr:MFS transporter [Rhodococcus sp. ACPA1]PBC54962.1 MFS transporter [Rhodococcus sp. ACPA1]